MRNRGTFERGRNVIITCSCCGRRTQSQIGGNTNLCAECYEFAGEYNEWQDGQRAAADLAETTCPRCAADKREALARA